MHHEMAMRIPDTIQNLAEELQPLAEIQTPFRRVPDQVGPFHELQDQVRGSLLQLATIQKASDSGMVETRENPALGPEPLAKSRRIDRSTKDLDGHQTFESIVGACGAIDPAHAALADLRGDRPGTDPPPDQRILPARLADVDSQNRELVRTPVRREEGADFGSQRGLRGGERFESRLGIRDILIREILEQAPGPLPECGVAQAVNSR